MKKNMEQSQKLNCLRKFKKNNTQQLYFGTLVLVLYWYYGDNIKYILFLKLLLQMKQHGG